MKTGAPDHWKMADLAKRAEVPVCYGIPWANGVMERIWHYARLYAPAGDIGKIPDSAIARMCFWPEEKAETLIEALVGSTWLDRHDRFRLVIHDWREHCEDSVHSKLARHHQYFWDGVAPKVTGLKKDEAETARAFYLKNPIWQPQCNPLQPVATPTQPVATPAQPVVNPLAVALAVADASAVADKAQAPAPPTPTKIISFGSDPSDDFDRMYRAHPITGKKREARMAYQQIIASAVNPESVNGAIVASHAEWCVFWKADGLKEWKPDFVQFFEDEWYLRKPRDSPKKKADDFNPAHQLYVDPFKNLKPEA